MKEEDLTPEQRAFLEEVLAFNAESKTLHRRRGGRGLSPAQRVQRRQRAQQLAARAKELFLGMKVEVA